MALSDTVRGWLGPLKESLEEAKELRTKGVKHYLTKYNPKTKALKKLKK